MGPQSRKRLVRWGILGIPAAFCVVTWLWFSSNCPLPAWLFEGGSRSSHSVTQAVVSGRDKLIDWKLRSATRSLNLEGSVWEHPGIGVTAEFGKDGVFRWRAFPDSLGNILPKEFLKLKELDGKGYTFIPEADLLCISSTPDEWLYMGTNLAISENPWQATIISDGRTLEMLVNYASPCEAPQFSFVVFERKIE